MRKIALFLCAVPFPVLAQTVPAEPIVVTATRVPTPLDDIPAGVTIIDRATIEARGYTDLVQALSAVPGLRVAQSGGPGAQASVFIRGTNSNHVLVLRDGVPVNDPADPSGAYDFGVDTLDDIERIEIIRGPLSSLYGSGAIGGVINLITRKAGDTLRASMTIAGGSNTTGLLRGDVSGRSGIWDFSANAEGFSTRGFDQTPPREAVYTGAANGDRASLGNAEIGVTPVAGTRIFMQLRGRDSVYGYDEQGAVTYDGDNATGRDNSASARLGISSHVLDDIWITTLSAGRLIDDRHYTVLPVATDPNGDSGDDRYHGRSADIQFANTIRPGDIGPLAAPVITAGYEHLNETADTHLNDVFGFAPYESATRGHDDTDSGWLGAEAALGGRLTVNGQLREDATTEAGSAFTWRAGGVLDVPEALTKIHAAYGTGFRAPALFERFGTDSYGYTGNPTLKPEHSAGWEAGIETQLQAAGTGAITLRATYFDNRIRDLIETVYTPIFTSTSVNIAEARAHGAEASMTLTVAAWLSAELSYTYTDARNLRTGELLLRRPENAASAALTLRPLPALTIVPDLTYTGRDLDYLVNDAGADLGTTGLTRPGTVLNLNASYRIDGHMSLFAWGKNLTGSHFEPVSGYVIPGPSVLAGVKLKL